jgi:hypothetical protein
MLRNIINKCLDENFFFFLTMKVICDFNMKETTF